MNTCEVRMKCGCSQWMRLHSEYIHWERLIMLGLTNRRRSLLAVAGAMALATSLGAGSASAEVHRYGFENKIKVGGPRTVHSGTVEDDSSDKAGCRNDAWLIGFAKWDLGKVTKKEIYVKSIRITYRTRVESNAQGQYLVRGNGGTVWRTRWDPHPIPGDARDHSATFKINKSVKLDSQKRVYFRSNMTMGRSGGAADCGGDIPFYFYLKLVG
ncbi:hypothetical protein [Streptomyces sp. NPDC058989]|uniref:hypothetical protein n=1 Tax=Streptomyces sp. NPDC058989 TaxID=3346686 RepID=UPI0036A4F23F